LDQLRSGHRQLAIEFDTESPADAAAASVAAVEECAADRLDRAGLRIADLHRHAITILIDYALECGSEADGDHRVFIDRTLQDGLDLDLTDTERRFAGVMAIVFSADDLQLPVRRGVMRSEERRVGEEWVGQGRYWG